VNQQIAADDGTAPARIGHAFSTEAGAPAPPTAEASTDVPADYLDLYTRAAATCPGLSWAMLAAIGSVESDHGRLSAPGVVSGANPAGAMGPMQFLEGTWTAYGADGNGDGVRDVYNPADAVFGAANYLCRNGAGQLSRLVGSVWDYNHANWYVAEVLDRAARYGAGDDPPVLALLRLLNRP
jgi:membrane-bound lytic murein transglycosylase B